jgi:hypothetical protein
LPNCLLFCFFSHAKLLLFSSPSPIAPVTAPPSLPFHLLLDHSSKQTAAAAAQNVPAPQESDIHDANAAHKKVYQEGNTSDASDDELGKAAGVEAFKAYERSESEESDRDGDSGGKSKLVQMAMAEAMKMFSGGGGQDKSAVIQSAVAMAMKLFAGKSGEGGGGVAQLMSMLGGGGDSKGGAMGMLSQAASNPQVADMLKKFM